MKYLRIEMYGKNIERILHNNDDVLVRQILREECGEGIVIKWPEGNKIGIYEVEGGDDVVIKFIKG